MELKDATNDVLRFKVPNEALGKEIHIIPVVKDISEISSRYDKRRIVLNV